MIEGNHGRTRDVVCERLPAPLYEIDFRVIPEGLEDVVNGLTRDVDRDPGEICEGVGHRDGQEHEREHPRSYTHSP